MPVWFENDAPNTRSGSASFISQLATGVPDAPEHATGERVAVGDLALGLERGEDRCVERLGQRDDLGHRRPERRSRRSRPAAPIRR